VQEEFQGINPILSQRRTKIKQNWHRDTGRMKSINSVPLPISGVGKLKENFDQAGDLNWKKLIL